MDPMEYIVPNRKRLPYGMMNFAVIRRERQKVPMQILVMI